MTASEPSAEAAERGQALMQTLFDLGYRSSRSDCAGVGAVIDALDDFAAQATEQ